MYLGLDLGTSGLRGLLIDESQRVIGAASVDYAVSRTAPLWAEQDPALWTSAAGAVIDRLAAQFPREIADLRGIGLSGQMHGATLYDRDGVALRPSILWNDSRAAAQAALLDANPVFRELTGNIVFPGFTAPKLLWVAAHEPRIFARIHKVLLPKDALRLWLSGETISEMSDASGTGWLDVARRDWSAALLAACGLSRDQMPDLVEGSAPAGRLRPDLAARWGIRQPVTLAGGAGDNAAAALGRGVVAEGEAFVSLGTSGVVFAATEGFRPRPESAVHAFCHALPGRWHQMGVILSATDALNWFAALTGQPAADLTEGLGTQVQPPGPELFLPYLAGERTPHNDASLRGAFHGLSHGSDRAALTRAVLEGVGFALADSLSALAEAGTRLERVTAVGGGANSPYWVSMLASLLDLEIALPKGAEHGAALGAARLGLMAATGAGPEICTPPTLAQVLHPDPALRPAFAEARERFRAVTQR